MATALERLHEWRELLDTQDSEEDPVVEAGRYGENLLRMAIETTLKHKNAYCFSGKRVPAKRRGGKLEIDLIVLTKKQLHILEVKNWSGEVFDNGINWVQIRNHGQYIEHPNLTEYNSEKRQALLDYLRSNGLELNPKLISQKVVFINSNIKLSNDISANSNVITPDRLPNYLGQQKGVSSREQLMHSIIEFCLNSEKGRIILDGLYNSMPKSDFGGSRKCLNQLETWDKVCLQGGRVLAGDCLKLYTKDSVIDFKKVDRNAQCKIRWTRSKALGLFKSLVMKSSLGVLELPNKKISIRPMDTLKFHHPGEQRPWDIHVRNINLLVRG